MIKKTIYLDNVSREIVNRTAFHTGKSKSEIIREAIRQYIRLDAERNQKLAHTV